MASSYTAVFASRADDDVLTLGISFVEASQEVQEVAVGSITITIHQNLKFGLGAAIWNSARFFLDCLPTFPPHLRVAGKRLVELGSGTGVLGIGCGAAGAESVVLTDLPALLPLLQTNITENSDKIPGCAFSALALDWSLGADALPFDMSAVDMIVLSDVVYEVGLIPLLANVLQVMTSVNDVPVVISHKCRFPSRELLYFDQLAAYFHITVVSHNAATLAASNIFVFEMRRRVL